MSKRKVGPMGDGSIWYLGQTPRDTGLYYFEGLGYWSAPGRFCVSYQKLHRRFALVWTSGDRTQKAYYFKPGIAKDKFLAMLASAYAAAAKLFPVLGIRSSLTWERHCRLQEGDCGSRRFFRTHIPKAVRVDYNNRQYQYHAHFDVSDIDTESYHQARAKALEANAEIYSSILEDHAVSLERFLTFHKEDPFLVG